MRTPALLALTLLALALAACDSAPPTVGVVQVEVRPTPTPTPTVTPTPTPTPVFLAAPTLTAMPAPTPIATLSPTLTLMPTPTPTPAPTPTPSLTPTATPAPTTSVPALCRGLSGTELDGCLSQFIQPVVPTHTPRPTPTPTPIPPHFCDEYLLDGYERQRSLCHNWFVGVGYFSIGNENYRKDGIMEYSGRENPASTFWCHEGPRSSTTGLRFPNGGRAMGNCVVNHLWRALSRSQERGETQIETLTSDFWCPAIPEFSGIQRSTWMSPPNYFPEIRQRLTVFTQEDCEGAFRNEEGYWLGRPN